MRRALALAVLLLSVEPALAGDFVDTRLNFTLTDENLLVKPGETNPSVPGVRIGQPTSLGILFFDNYDTRYTGYENLTHLAIHKVLSTARFTAEGAFVLRLLQFTDVSLSSIDEGSYIRLQYWFDRNHAQEGRGKTNIALTAFPLSADRMRLGYSYRISWGGNPVFFKFNPDLPSTQPPQNPSPAPGFKLQLSGERYYAYAGFKTSTLLDKAVQEQVAVYGVLAGFGVDIVPKHFRLEANGGYFDRASNPLFFSTDPGATAVRGFPVATFGGTLQLSVFSGLSPSQSIDLTLYRNDPISAQRYFTRPTYGPGFNWIVSTEWTGLGSTLQDVDRPNSTKIQAAYAGDVNLRFQTGFVRFKADFMMRSLSYILVNQPSLVPFQDFPKGSRVTEEIFGAVGFDYLFEKIGLTVGATAGMMRPATFTPPAGQVVTLGKESTASTVVVRGEGDYSILPEPDAAKGRSNREVPIGAAKIEVREDFLEYFAAILQVYYQYDANQTRFFKDPGGSSIRDFNFPHRLGFNITLQARY